MIVSVASASEKRTLEQEHRALLEVSEQIVREHDLTHLFHRLAEVLPRVLRFDFLSLLLYVPERDTMVLKVLETATPTRFTVGGDLGVDASPSGWVWHNQQPLIISEMEREERWPEVLGAMRDFGLQTYCSLPLTTGPERLGTIGFGRREPHGYDAADVEFMRRIANQAAVAVASAVHAQRAEAERDRFRLLLEINNALISSRELKTFFPKVAACLREVIPNEFASLALYDAERDVVRVAGLEMLVNPTPLEDLSELPAAATPSGRAIRERKPLLLDREGLAKYSTPLLRRLVADGIQTAIFLPLVCQERVVGALNFATRRENAFSQADVELLAQAAGQVALTLDNALAWRQIESLKDRLAQEKLYLEGEIESRYSFEEIVGQSAALRDVLKQIEIVAPTDATVLIEGETGVGKELIARAVHYLSHRRERTFVKLNCAAIPTGLLESELFGHEKGAFTGAISRKTGRFELADRGTLFLDEVGDIPLELQPKLLRVLQEREFERLGSTRTTHVNVRLVAATNRDLSQMVEAGQFRNDLFYRLKVFPVKLPALRDRREDIPLLVRYFVGRCARRMGRRIESIAQETMARLIDYPWPGNVRELENFIERAVILSTGPVLNAPLGELAVRAAPAASHAHEAKQPEAVTLIDVERQAILRALHDANWVIGGAAGAASRLGMKRTTLRSRMEKLGITRPSSQ